MFIAWLSLVSFCHPLLIKAIVPSVVISRCERLEEQLNDLTELHQNEILNLKQELASMEEKIAYQSYERARDIQVGDRTRTQVLPSNCSFRNSFTFEVHLCFSI